MHNISTHPIAFRFAANTPNCELFFIRKTKQNKTKTKQKTKKIVRQVSLTDPDTCQKDFVPLPHDYEIRHHQPLRLKKKIYEFYTAPITKFWADSVR